MKTGRVGRNITLRRVRVTIVAMVKQYLLHILSVCLQPKVSGMQCACTVFSSVVYSVLQLFLHYLINCAIFGGKKLLNIKCVC
jgi:hypothetical protein